MGLAEIIHYYWTEQADPRTNDWTFVGSPIPIGVTLAAYLYFVLVFGPNYMKRRQPYSLKGFIKAYNIFQVFANTWIVYSFIKGGWFTDLGIYCEPVDYSMNPKPYRLATTMWWGLLLKLSDLIETGVYVLRKKDKQISFLHLYHHVSTLLIQWICTKYVPGGMATFIVLVNCSVHVAMYSYYFLSTLGPNVQRVITPFKPLLTIIQMVQFVILMAYSIQSLYPSCPVPRIPGPVLIVNLIINFYLFYDFYKKSYIKETKTK